MLWKLALFSNSRTSITSSQAGIIAAGALTALITYALDGLPRECHLYVRIAYSTETGVRPIGRYVDKSGVALRNGGGTLVLGTHDDVSIEW